MDSTIGRLNLEAAPAKCKLIGIILSGNSLLAFSIFLIKLKYPVMEIIWKFKTKEFCYD